MDGSRALMVTGFGFMARSEGNGLFRVIPAAIGNMRSKITFMVHLIAAHNSGNGQFCGGMGIFKLMKRTTILP